MTSHFVQEDTLELKKDTKKTVLYQNKNLGTVLSEAVLGSRKRSDLILTLDKLILARYDEEDRVIENSQVVTSNDLNNKLSIDRIIANCEEVQIDTDGWGHINFARELGNDWYIILFAYPPGWNFSTRNASKNGFDVQVLINETPVKEQKLWITWLAITP